MRAQLVTQCHSLGTSEIPSSDFLTSGIILYKVMIFEITVTEWSLSVQYDL